MIQYNMLEAKNNLSKICKMIVDKEEDYIIIASNGKPLVKVIPYEKNTTRKPGILKGKGHFDYELFNSLDKEIEKMFYGEEED